MAGTDPAARTAAPAEGLRVAGLSAGYGRVPALREVSFTARRGSVTAVLGANGAGKTTLLRALTGLLRPSAGSAWFGRTELTRLAAEEVVRRGVAHVPEGRGVIEELTVEENLRLGGLVRIPRAQRRRELAQAYRRFPVLGERRHRPAHNLSGGERQMLALGRALMSRPLALLLDEPSLGLAPRAGAQLTGMIRDLAADTGLTVLLVEQNATTALSVADRAVLLALGRVVREGPAAELAADPDLRHHYLGF
jgi:branched-chain amino acid transport system ATP-binding protein